MILITLKNCDGCEEFKKKHPEIPFIELPNKSRGFGDTFAKLTHILGIKQCKSCYRRQHIWNRWFSYFGINYSKEYRNIIKILNLLNIYEFPVVLNDDLNSTIPLSNFDKPKRTKKFKKLPRKKQVLLLESQLP
jgi:hypothetical protein